MSTNPPPINDGGPVHPCSRIEITKRDAVGLPMKSEHVPYVGMSIRDEFAGRAMQGIVSSIDSEEAYLRIRSHATCDGLKVSQWIARDAYKQADAMIAARAEGRK